MRIAVIGSGGVGGMYGAALAQAFESIAREIAKLRIAG